MLTVEDVRRLDRLALGSSAGAFAVATGGARRTRTLGHGAEFQDYRRYQFGDDPRAIDWTVDARLRQLVVRLFRADGQVRLHVLVDVSRSMSIGQPSKLACARKIAAALCYVGVARRAAVGLATFDARIRAHVAPAVGRPQLFRAFELLRAADATGASAIDRALVAYGGVVRGPGLVVVLSDFYESEPAFEGLKYLLYRGLTPALVQVVAREEIAPDVSDAIELVDVEDPTAPALVIEPGEVDRYLTRMSRLTEAIRSFSRDRGLPWAQVQTSTSFDGLMTSCVQAGLLDAYA